MNPQRIGVFGGTFDPVHSGHLQLAERAIKEVNLSQLLFVPAATPPHKHGNITSFRHRIAMLNLVCQGSEYFVCSSIEAELPRPSYTVDTLTELLERYPVNIELFFVIGGDAFLDLMTWKSYAKILTMVKMVVSPRVGYSNQRLYAFMDCLGYSQKNDKWQGGNGQKDIILLSQPPMEACSRDVRDGIEKDGDSSILLPEAVAGYIRENNLYNF